MVDKFCECKEITGVARDGKCTCAQCGGIDAYKTSPLRNVKKDRVTKTEGIQVLECIKRLDKSQLENLKDVVTGLIASKELEDEIVSRILNINDRPTDEFGNLRD